MAIKRDFNQTELPPIPEAEPSGSGDHMVTLGEILAQYPAPKSKLSASKATNQSNRGLHAGKNNTHWAIKTGVLTGIVIGCAVAAVLLIVGD
jgi:hypothetical protein